jgi:hypothetical protein
MTLLPVNVNTREWHAIRDYIEARRVELLAELDSLTASDQARRDAAVRRDELAVLLQAPAETLRESQARDAANRGARPTY